MLKKRKCKCGFEVAVRTSWTNENPGRKFIACKLYNHDTGHRGCQFFEWLDEDPLEWQRDVINTLIAEKHRFATDLSLLRGRVALIEHEKKRLTNEMERMKKKTEKRKGCESSCKHQIVKTDHVGLALVIGGLVMLSVVVSVVVVKVVG
ncbi:uncharacterized protein LOC125493740 [Beta vulgaris subsp. vulgaris]|uniref:uncharacterized protein LOC125493740 n=1 Tax=Beta vulgaris subsp. vulgaris TaxID=3555 RepID=UPI0020375007|nr:uncharacterized protein LOC125493740 [Beta vulgaris subsp. vulgaris]